MLATALVIAPFALVGGIMVQVQKKYRPANVIGWMITMVGFGLLTLLRADSDIGKWVGYQFVAAAGTGMIVSPSNLHINTHLLETASYSTLVQFSLFSLLSP